MRYRLFRLQDRGVNASSATAGMWKPCGSTKTADSAKEALASHPPMPGTWMVLCDDDHTWAVFTVSERTETDIEPADVRWAA